MRNKLIEPIDMMLFCPKCGLQHIDAPDARTPDWNNPPHRSHLCHGCGCIWRPADIPTNGVAGIQTRGTKDTVFYNRAAIAAYDTDDRIKKLQGEILRLVDALVYAHDAGFEWPVDPLPFGSIAHNLFIERGNDPERIATRQVLTGAK
jgi:hypothetical protein